MSVSEYVPHTFSLSRRVPCSSFPPTKKAPNTTTHAQNIYINSASFHCHLEHKVPSPVPCQARRCIFFFCFLSTMRSSVSRKKTKWFCGVSCITGLAGQGFALERFSQHEELLRCAVGIYFRCVYECLLGRYFIFVFIFLSVHARSVRFLELLSSHSLSELMFFPHKYGNNSSVSFQTQLPLRNQKINHNHKRSRIRDSLTLCLLPISLSSPFFLLSFSFCVYTPLLSFSLSV